MKIIAEKKEAGRVLKVENSGKVGNSETREKKMAQFVKHWRISEVNVHTDATRES